MTWPTEAAREAVTSALAENWRNMHTNESLGLQRMLAGHVLTALAPHVEQGHADAWDEGYDAGHTHARAVTPEWPVAPINPYRGKP